MDVGNKIRIDNEQRMETFAGLEWVQTCSCWSCPNMHQVPITVYEESGKIKKRVMLEKDVHIIEPVNPQDKKFHYYKLLINEKPKEK